MGSVWLADHLTLDTQVAVKFMSAALATDEAAIARFTREATAAAKIKSRHVVQTLDSGVTKDGVPFIVMELLLGEDLGARLERAGALSLDATATVLAHACKALTQAHQHGIVHRDIKPENIFFTESDGDTVIKLLDFGIAKRLGTESFSATASGSIMGTPLYMSPEQVVSSKTVQSASDLWSLGVVAYQSLTGALPFDGETLGAILIAINSATYMPPTERRPGLPAAVDEWMARALAREADSRFASAQEMADAFHVAIGARTSLRPSQPVTLSSAELGERPPARLQRTFMGTAVTDPPRPIAPRAPRPLAVALGTLVTGVLVAGVVLFTRRPAATTAHTEPPVQASGSMTSTPLLDIPLPPDPSPPPLAVEATSLPVAGPTALPRPVTLTSASSARPSPASSSPTVPATAPQKRKKDRGF